MTPTLRRARVLAALRELDVAIDFGWRDWSCFCARPYDWMADDLAPGRVVFEVREVTPAHVTVSVFDQGASAGRLSFDAVSWERMRGRAVVGTPGDARPAVARAARAVDEERRHMKAIDLFAGPGGWDVGAAALGIEPVGVEYDDAA